MTIKRIAATTAAAVLLACPSSSWTIVPPTSGGITGARNRRTNALIRRTTTSHYMAAAIADGSGQDYHQSSPDSTGWHQRVLRRVFRRRSRRKGLEMSAAVAHQEQVDLQQALNLMGRPFDLRKEQESRLRHNLSHNLDVLTFENTLPVDPVSVHATNSVESMHMSLHPMTARNGQTSRQVEATSASIVCSVKDLPVDQLNPFAAADSIEINEESSSMIASALEAEIAQLTTTQLPAASSPVESTVEGGSPFVRITRPWVQNILVGLLDRWSQGSHVNLCVNCHPQSNTLDLVQGRFACDASVDFDRIVFGAIQMHKGRIEVSRLNLGLWSLTPSPIPVRGHRYLNQFEFHGRNITFTQEDLVDSRCIRNGLKNLLSRILKLRGTKAVRISIDTIVILPNGKISCRGAAKTVFGKILEFEVRSGLGFTSRGHVLTFPGLEISLNPGFGMFVPVLPAISLDLGHNAQLLDLHFDGKAAQMIVSAKVTIAPHHTLKVRNYKQSKDAYLAQYSVDVGRWLTRLGNFTK
ncbi:hypothetical protein MPSEU_000258700 [Mayamaea pseudoterrestris]|nr:hypothetical protein MPSEU_000258700 [Mayamaea pseudoterrestris]